MISRERGMDLTFEHIGFRLFVALILSSMIGLEREVHGKPAGIRTHALVGLGAAIMTVCGILVTEQYDRNGSDTVTVDPTRLASVVIQGIGFIGAGVILQSRGFVKGLTTASTLWFVAALGIAGGFGFWEMAVVSTIFALILLVLFKKMEEEIEHLEYIHAKETCEEERKIGRRPVKRIAPKKKRLSRYPSSR